MDTCAFLKTPNFRSGSWGPEAVHCVQVDIFPGKMGKNFPQGFKISQGIMNEIGSKEEKNIGKNSTVYSI